MSGKKRLLFIINPKSGTKSKEKLPDLINEIIDAKKFSVEIAKTQHPKHATELSKKAADENYFAVIAVGGDGTVNETAQSLIKTETALGIVPCGSGNALARELKIPMKRKQALHIINNFNIKCIDTGKVNDKPFFCAVGLGFEALVAERFSKLETRGLKSYLKTATKTYPKYKCAEYAVKTSEQEFKTEAFQLSICNTSQYGNNAYISPNSRLNDGKLELNILKKFKVAHAPALIAELFTKKLTANSHFQTIPFQEIEISQPEEQPIHIDGEPMLSGKDFKITINPLSLNVIAKG